MPNTYPISIEASALSEQITLSEVDGKLFGNMILSENIGTLQAGWKLHFQVVTIELPTNQ